MRGCCNPTRKIMPENEGPGQVLFYEWKCVARGHVKNKANMAGQRGPSG